MASLKLSGIKHGYRGSDHTLRYGDKILLGSLEYLVACNDFSIILEISDVKNTSLGM